MKAVKEQTKSVREVKEESSYAYRSNSFINFLLWRARSTIGALPAFIFCGFLGFLGVAAAMAGASFDWHSIIT